MCVCVYIKTSTPLCPLSARRLDKHAVNAPVPLNR